MLRSKKGIHGWFYKVVQAIICLFFLDKLLLKTHSAHHFISQLFYSFPKETVSSSSFSNILHFLCEFHVIVCRWILCLENNVTHYCWKMFFCYLFLLFVIKKRETFTTKMTKYKPLLCKHQLSVNKVDIDVHRSIPQSHDGHIYDTI